MNNKKSKSKKLSVNRQTIQKLTAESLREVAGGTITISLSCSCGSCWHTRCNCPSKGCY
jgi:hypothetical protein